VSEESSTEAGAQPADFVAVSRLAHYHLEERIGAGGMAVVFRARDERLRRRVALKVLAPALAADEAFRHRFIRESRAAAAVDDPHIIPVFEAGEADGVLFLAMRYVAGGDVRTLARREGPLSPERALAIISPVASALDAAHGAGLVHRDVKPANMLVDVRPGRPDHVYLSDFGLSKSVTSSLGPTRTGQFLGTPGYSAPEQLDGKPVDGRADQYSLACAAFELLCGETPFPRDQVAAVIWAHMAEPPPALTSRRPGLPHAVDSVLQKALAKAPADRFASCRAFADALREALGFVSYNSGSELIPHADDAGAGPSQSVGSRAVKGNSPARAAIGKVSNSPGEREASRLDATPEATASWPGEQRQAHRAGARHQAQPAFSTSFPPRSSPSVAANGGSLPEMAAGGIPVSASNPKHRILPRPVMTRRRLLATGIGCSAAAGLAGILWETTTANRSVRYIPRRTAIWQASVPFGPGAIMAVGADMVFVAGGSQGPHGNVLHALSASHGTTKWRFTTQIGAIPSLAATARNLWVGLYPIYGLNPKDGATLWTSYYSPTSDMVAAGGSVYFMNATLNGYSYLISLNGGDGTELWAYPDAVGSVSAPVVADGVVYVLGSSQLWALRASDGRLIWQSGAPDGGSLATDGTILCGVYRSADIPSVQPQGELLVWRASDGKLLWHSTPDGGFGAPALAAGVIYVVSVSGTLYALRARDGRQLWEYPANVQTTPVIANGRVYAGSSAGGLVALRASDGIPIWQFPARISIGPVVAGSTVYVSNGTRVYAINS
jgi:serine/threonine-protein kinase